MGEHIVTIEKMAFGGSGFGHLEGKACFVPFTAPGDVARIRVKVEKSSFLEGEVTEIIESSPWRTTPPCPVFGNCGGCNWQHISYPAQIGAKEEIFAELLWRMGRVERELIEPMIPAPEPFGYRSRIQMKIRFFDGQIYMGFYRGGTHFVVDVPGNCAIAGSRLNLILDDLKRVICNAPEPEKIPQIDVATGDDDRVELVIHYIGDRKGDTAGYFHKNRSLLGADICFLQTGRKATLERIFGDEFENLAYSVPDPFSPGSSGYRLQFSNGGFSQVNYRQNLQLIETVCNWAALTGKEKVLDIYCGNGNLSIPLSGNVMSVLGVEDYGPSIASAEKNCEANGVTNAKFQCMDAVTAIEKLAAGDDTFDLVLLDPPRSGAREVAVLIPQLRPKRIIYVSCDPATLSRDIGILKKSGYAVSKSRPVDLFPQTYHIESVTLLENPHY